MRTKLLGVKQTIVVLIFAVLMPLFSGAQNLFGEDKSKFDFAWEQYRTGNYSSAVRYCTELIENLSANRRVDVYKLRAMAYRAVGDYTKAAFDYSEVIQYGRKEPSVFIDLAQVYICQKEFEKAEDKLSEALRLFREFQPGQKNNFLLEELGRVRHYLGDYNEAIRYLKEAVENNSAMGQIDLLSALFRANDLLSVKYYSDSLLNRSIEGNYGLLSDSSLFYYVRGLNSIARSADPESIQSYLEKAILHFRNADNRCFRGYYNDITAAQAYSHLANGRDSMAFVLYKKMYASNPRQQDIIWKLDDLKAKLNLDQTPPSIVLKNPFLDGNNTFTVSNVVRYEMYGQVSDSSGIATVSVNNMPVSKIEDDGLFVFNLELQSGRNEIMISAMDKNENKAVKTFIINNVQGEDIRTETLADLQELETNIKYHAVLIAESEYEDQKFADLKKPSQNVNELKQILVKDYLFDEKNIVTIMNGTKQDILDSIEVKATSLTDNDNLLIFYAGHGTIRKVGSEVVGGYLIPTDAKKDKWTTYINSHDLKEPLKETDAKHVLFIVDACFGGALFRSTMDDAPASIKQSYFTRSRKMLTSGNLEEVADDSRFFENLKQFLTLNAVKYTTAQELAVFIKKNSDTNNPQYERIQDLGDNGGQFVFIKGSANR